MDLLSDLNEPQRQAVTHVDGPLLILAGAGSGKTRVITRRIAYLKSQGIAPASILAITFTNKAAGEMRRRVEALGVQRGFAIGTFHAVSARLLREHAGAAGLARDFTIYDADDQFACVKEAMKRLEIPTANFPPAMVHALISRAKNKLQRPAEYAAATGAYSEKVVAQIYAAYQKILDDNQALDFDDLLLRLAFLMAEHPDIRQELGRRFRYVLIDEYQDTNHAQYVIAHGIALEHENICATGDPDQSIYAWRGADIRNIMDFEQDYPNARVIRLERNYRSVQPILTAAASLIAHNRQRKHKDLLATRPGGADVTVARLEDERAEARYVAGLVAQLHSAKVAYRDVAVFYRVNALSRVLEEAFRRAGIPYQIARGVEFYNRKEIKDVLAYLRLLVNPKDDVSCRRIINVPARGIGATTLGKLLAAAQQRGLSLREACDDPGAAGVGPSAAEKVLDFARLMRRLTEAGQARVEQTIRAVLDQSGLEDSLKGDEDMQQALRNVGELVLAAADFDKENPGATLADYLHQVSLVSDVDTLNAESGAVTFMTLHAAKGLEFKVVAIIGWEEGLLPFVRQNRTEPRDLEEERRLAFVGMTRAEDYLYLTGARRRVIRGTSTRQVESPFLGEIGDECVNRLDQTGPEPPARRAAVDVDEYNRYQSPARDGFCEDADQRADLEAQEAADLLPEQFSHIRPGKRVRHPMFGAGWVVYVGGSGENAKAVIEFDRAGRKTIILQYAKLEPL